MHSIISFSHVTKSHFSPVKLCICHNTFEKNTSVEDNTFFKSHYKNCVNNTCSKIMHRLPHWPKAGTGLPPPLPPVVTPPHLSAPLYLFLFLAPRSIKRLSAAHSTHRRRFYARGEIRQKCVRCFIRVLLLPHPTTCHLLLYIKTTGKAKFFYDQCNVINLIRVCRNL